MSSNGDQLDLATDDLDDVFEITDFTIGSDFERSVNDLEVLLQKWSAVHPHEQPLSHEMPAKWTPGEFEESNEHWLDVYDTCAIGGTTFRASHHKLASNAVHPGSKSSHEVTSDQDRMLISCMVDDETLPFDPSKSHIPHWYALPEYALISATSVSTEQVNDKLARLLLSVVACALSNTTCGIPVFLKQRKDYRTSFSGLCIYNGFRTHFSMCHLIRCRGLKCVYDMFTEKLRRHNTDDFQDFSISCRHVYVNDQQVSSARKLYLSTNTSVNELPCFPVGCRSDPINKLELCCQWQTIPHAEYIRLQSISPALVDQVVSFCEPDLCPKWSLSSMLNDNIDCIGSCCLERIFTVMKSPLPSYKSESVAENRRASLLSLKTVWSVSSRIHDKASQYISGLSSLDEDRLKRYVRELFDSSARKSVSKDSDRSPVIKSAPTHSLTRDYAKLIAHTLNESSASVGVGYLSILHSQFVQELKHHWEHKIRIISVGGQNQPEYTHCLFHQKLQLLNYTMEKSLDQTIEAALSEQRSIQDTGRLKPLDGIVSTFDGATPIYVPHTQSLPVLTEDMVENLQVALHDCGDFGSDARLQLQSAVLKSDMESFKFANKWSTLEDFLRYYSPRDVKKDENGDWILSERMRAPGNIWTTLWDGTLAVPVSQQASLFNCNDQGDGVIEFFSNLTIGQLASQLLPVILDLYYSQLTLEASRHDLSIKQLDELCPRWELEVFQSRNYQASLWTNFNRIERQVCECKSLRSRFKSTDDSNGLLHSIIEQLSETGESEVINDLGKEIVRSLFEVKIGGLPGFPAPFSREVILKCLTNIPDGLKSRPSPQRMYAMLSQAEVFICGAFTEDTLIK